MTHPQARERLLDYVYGEMGSVDVVAFEAIARQDPALQAELDEVAFVRRAASGLRQGAALPATARRRILAVADRATVRRTRAQRWEAAWASFLSPAFLGTAAVVVAVGLAVPWIVQQGRVEPDAASPQAVLAPPPPPVESGPGKEGGAAKPRVVTEPRPVDAALLLSDARTERAAGRNPEALDLCRRALAAEPTGDLLADVLAEAAEVAALVSRRAEADDYLDRLERLPGGAERAAKIRGR
jgi:hypothetical protein